LPNLTTNYGLVIPLVTDNVTGSTIPLLGSSNVIVDTQIKSLHDQDTILQSHIDTNYTTLNTKIDTNYTTTNTKIDTQDNTINERIDNLILNSAPLPSVAAQEVMDARFSPVYSVTYPVLTDRLTFIETEIQGTQSDIVTLQSDIVGLQSDISNLEIQVEEFVSNYAAIIRLGGIT